MFCFFGHAVDCDEQLKISDFGSYQAAAFWIEQNCFISLRRELNL